MRPPNIDKPIKEVKHADMERANPDNPYRSVCTACDDGILLVKRDLDDFELAEIDMCIACGQQFRYLDIEEMRANLG